MVYPHLVAAALAQLVEIAEFRMGPRRLAAGSLAGPAGTTVTDGIG